MLTATQTSPKLGSYLVEFDAADGHWSLRVLATDHVDALHKAAASAAASVDESCQMLGMCKAHFTRCVYFGRGGN